MNEHQFGDKVAHILNQGLRMDARKAQRLRSAREQALAHLRPEPRGVLAWAGHVTGALGGWSGLSMRLLGPLAALGIALSAIYTWQQNHRVAEVEEIDTLLLTDELPIDAYLDRGFQNWLKKRAAEQ